MGMILRIFSCRTPSDHGHAQRTISENGCDVGAYEKLTETVGVDSTLTIFREQVKAVRKEPPNRSE